MAERGGASNNAAPPRPFAFCRTAAQRARNLPGGLTIEQAMRHRRDGPDKLPKKAAAFREERGLYKTPAARGCGTAGRLPWIVLDGRYASIRSYSILDTIQYTGSPRRQADQRWMPIVDLTEGLMPPLACCFDAVL